MALTRRLLSLIAIFIVTISASIAQSAYSANAQTQASGRVSALDAPAPAAQVVDVGMYVNTAYQLEVASSTYYLDAYLWFKWSGDIDPTATMEITNLVEEWGAMITPLNEEPVLLPDGSKYKLLKVEGRFMQPFVLADYPLDRQKLSIYLEDNTFGSDQLVYVMDSEGSGYGHMLAIPGWQIEQWSSQQLEHDYGSFFGAEKAGSASIYSTLRFDIEIARPINFFVWKLLLPLVILLMASWMVLIIDPKLVEVRTALPATGLLTAVFLQQSYSDGLPEVGYLVLIDKIYAVAYAMILLTLLRAIWTSKTDLVSAAGIAREKATDQSLLFAQVIFFMVAVTTIIVVR